MNVRRVVTVSGIVQGVNFRWYTQQQASALGVRGWVTNLPDGRVELCAEGDEKAVNELIGWCRRGPSSARVESVEVRNEPYRGEFDGFGIRR